VLELQKYGAAYNERKTLGREVDFGDPVKMKENRTGKEPTRGQK